MLNTDNKPQIPKNQSPIIDDRSGFVARDWYRFFLNLLASVSKSFEYSSGTQVAPNYVGTLTVSGVDCVNQKVTVSAWGGGETIAADAYLVGYAVTNRTANGCIVNVKNLGAGAQTLTACVVVNL